MHVFRWHLSIHEVILINAVGVDKINDNRVVQEILALVTFRSNARFFFAKVLRANLPKVNLVVFAHLLDLLR